MKNGFWIPISKNFTYALPKNREYTELEAAYCLQLDYDNKKEVTLTGYASLWRWSVGRVYRFFDKMKIKIQYPETTQKKQNQNGMIIDMITEGYRYDNGMIRLIKNKGLEDETKRKRNENGMKTEGSRTTTIDTNILNPDLEPKSKTFLSDSDEVRLSEFLFSLILRNNPKAKKPNMQAWAKHISLAIERDKRTPEELGKVIRWCQDDSFWQSNILSTQKLRKKFDQLWLKMGTGVKAPIYNPQTKEELYE